MKIILMYRWNWSSDHWFGKIIRYFLLLSLAYFKFTCLEIGFVGSSMAHIWHGNKKSAWWVKNRRHERILTETNWSPAPCPLFEFVSLFTIFRHLLLLPDVVIILPTSHGSKDSRFPSLLSSPNRYQTSMYNPGQCLIWQVFNVSTCSLNKRAIRNIWARCQYFCKYLT
jgi:hypothetical protein